MLSIQIEWML